MIKNPVASFLLTFLFAGSTCLAQKSPELTETYRLQPIYFADREAVHAQHGAVAGNQPLANQAALQVLQNGGNAFDAAITAAAVLSVVEPYMMGLGGDMFAIFWSAKDQRVLGINASGRSGSLSTREELLKRGYEQMPFDGAESINVPGSLAGWNDVLQKFGSISLAEALQPAIKLAEEGFPISVMTAVEWSQFVDDLQRCDEARTTFLVNGERAPRAGELFRNPDLAATFKLIAKNGPDALYNSKLTKKIVEHVREHNGLLTVEDFRNHKSEWVEPISVAFGNHRVWELPPNGQGVAALEMLRILDGFDIASMEHNSAEYLHHLIEAKKIAFADLQYYVGDPDFMQIDPEQLLTNEFVARRRALLNPAHAEPSPPADRSLSTRDTTYIAVADKDGNMISMINSLAGTFGSGVVVPGTGFALQNRAVAFTLEEGRANTVAPRKRPFHTLTPGFVTQTNAEGKQDPFLALGLIGGYQQPQGQLQILFNILYFGMDVQSAISAGRFRHIEGPYTFFETAIPLSVVTTLEAMGHQSAPSQTPGLNGFDFGNAQGIMKTNDGYVAGSDPRRDGGALGY